MDENTQLSPDERAELEALRAEKAAAEERAKAQAEREELERLRAEEAARKAREEADAHTREVAERNRRLMEPDEDLRMPLAQKLVLVVLAVIVIASIIYFVNGS